MAYILGIDTSNYTTSACVYNDNDDTPILSGKLLPVTQGQLGLRQSDAVFEHVRQLGRVVNEALSGIEGELSAVAVSVSPRNRKDSYMPCFLVGKCVAECIASVNKLPVYTFSHQEGHLMAALYSSGRLDLIGKEFLAFHISGGTTDLMLVKPDKDTCFRCELIGSSLDLKIGQAVDRLGNLFGLPFPSGKYLDEIAQTGKRIDGFSSIVKGTNCSVSGYENRFNQLYDSGFQKNDIAYSFFLSIANLLKKMSVNARIKYGELPIIFSGGVMSNSIIKKELLSKLSEIYFAKPQFSTDNAAGIALLGHFKNIGRI